MTPLRSRPVLRTFGFERANLLPLCRNWPRPSCRSAEHLRTRRAPVCATKQETADSHAELNSSRLPPVGVLSSVLIVLNTFNFCKHFDAFFAMVVAGDQSCDAYGCSPKSKKPPCGWLLPPTLGLSKHSEVAHSTGIETRCCRWATTSAFSSPTRMRPCHPQVSGASNKPAPGYSPRQSSHGGHCIMGR